MGVAISYAKVSGMYAGVIALRDLGLIYTAGVMGKPGMKKGEIKNETLI